MERYVENHFTFDEMLRVILGSYSIGLEGPDYEAKETVKIGDRLSVTYTALMYVIHETRSIHRPVVQKVKVCKVETDITDLEEIQKILEENGFLDQTKIASGINCEGESTYYTWKKYVGDAILKYFSEERNNNVVGTIVGGRRAKRTIYEMDDEILWEDEPSFADYDQLNCAILSFLHRHPGSTFEEITRGAREALPGDIFSDRLVEFLLSETIQRNI